MSDTNNGHNHLHSLTLPLTQVVNGQGGVILPQLIFPDIKWDDADYARLVCRFDMFTDFIIFTKYRDGEVTERFLVNPTETAAAIGGFDLNSGLLPERCLFWSKKGGLDRLAIYIPPGPRFVTMRNEPQAWRVPLPGLVFVGYDFNYNLWAVKEPPVTPSVPLFAAPCPNIHEGVCRGNAPFPRASCAAIWQAVDVFFSSKFNQDLSDGKSIAYPKSVVEQWRVLNQVNAEEYPLDDLVETKLTLGRLIDAS